MSRPLAVVACLAAALLLAACSGTPAGRGEPAPPAAEQPAPKPPAPDPTADGEKPRDAGAANRRALLVGVSKYPNLAERLQLVGPANDVILMRTTLVKHFGFADANIVTLSEADGEKDPAKFPTRANIEREFKRLAEVSKPGDEVVVLLGGHGSQQPEDPKSPDPEPDGLDEIFLPRDVGKWNNSVGKVENAIIDDELGAWVTAIRDRKAFVFLVIDACHSGTMMRGADDLEKPRKSDGVIDLDIPKNAIADAEKKAAEREAAKAAKGEAARGGGPLEPTSLGLANKPGVFAIYAAQPTETTPERPMPPSAGRDGTQHGVLSYTICQIMTQSRTAGAPVSYRELGLRIQQQYQSWGRTSPTPMVEYPDTDPDRQVLGPGVWKDRSNIILTGSPGEYKVNAGQMTGLTSGSVLRVIPPAGVGDQPLGHVRVKAVRMLDSDVEPCAFEKVPLVKDLPNNGRCAVAFVDYGDVQMKLAVATHYPSADPKLESIPADVRADVAAKLKKLARPDGIFRVVDDVSSAAWLVVPRRDKQLVLMPAAGASPADAASAKGYGPVPTDDEAKMKEKLDKILGLLAKADGLIQMAADRTEDLAGADDSSPKFEVKLELRDANHRPIMPLRWPATDLRVFDKDKIRITVHNTGPGPIDVTILYVDTDRNITGLYPAKVGNTNRVKPGELPAAATIDVGATTTGREHIVVIAVAAEGGEKNFLDLVQKAPEKATPRGTPAGNSRLGKLLDRKVHGAGEEDSTRGVTLEEAADHAMTLVSWQLQPRQRPKVAEKK